MLGRILLVTVLTLALGATAARAQIGYPPGRTPYPGGRGGMPGRGGPRWPGGAMPEIPDLTNPVRAYIDDRSSDLRLSDAQSRQVDSIAAALDRQNDTLVAQVKRAFGEDSLPAGDGGARSSRDPGDDLALRDRLNALKPTIKEIQKNDDVAWKAASALLDKQQKKDAEKFRKDDEKERRRERDRWRGRGGGGSF